GEPGSPPLISATRVACSTRLANLFFGNPLGHVQRGGMPSALDRIITTAFGKAAVDLGTQKKYDQMVTWQKSQVVNVPLENVLLQSPSPVSPNSYLVQTARALGTYIGELPD
ncbi:MAG TPA: hypothetical protein V6C93_25060, partial [Allocoleopsis sp.]